ncbi:hypothetical protein QUA86_07180 [Microcoleus sp. F6_B6]
MTSSIGTCLIPLSYRTRLTTSLPPISLEMEFISIPSSLIYTNIFCSQPFLNCSVR